MPDEAAAKVDKSGGLFLLGFGLLWMLFAGGIFGAIILASLGIIGVNNDTSEPPNIAMFGVMLAMFSVGPALAWAGGSELWSLRSQDALRTQFPGQPWKWDARWTGGVIPADAASEAFWAWYGAIAFSLFLAPFVIQLTVISFDWRFLILVPFVALDLFLFRFAWRRTFSARRYGKLGLRLSQLPLRPGAPFEVLLSVPANLEGQAKLQLTCTRTYSTSGRKGGTQSETVFDLSKEVGIIASGARSMISGGFELPPGPVGLAYTWRLELTGAELSEVFVLPVFPGETEVERFTLSGTQP